MEQSISIQRNKLYSLNLNNVSRTWLVYCRSLILNNAFSAHQISTWHLSVHDTIAACFAELRCHCHPHDTVFSMRDGKMLWIYLAMLVSFVSCRILWGVLENHLARREQTTANTLMIGSWWLMMHTILILVYNVEKPCRALRLDVVTRWGGSYNAFLDKIHHWGTVIFGHYSRLVMLL